LVIDDTGFVKKGDKSCGVGRQYTGKVGAATSGGMAIMRARIAYQAMRLSSRSGSGRKLNKKAPMDGTATLTAATIQQIEPIDTATRCGSRVRGTFPNSMTVLQPTAIVITCRSVPGITNTSARPMKRIGEPPSTRRR
jgi:hypothetical protein